MTMSIIMNNKSRNISSSCNHWDVDPFLFSHLPPNPDPAARQTPSSPPQIGLRTFASQHHLTCCTAQLPHALYPEHACVDTIILSSNFHIAQKYCKDCEVASACKVSLLNSTPKVSSEVLPSADKVGWFSGCV